MQRTAVETANEVVPIAFVCNEIGMGLPDVAVLSGRSIRVRCPFGDLYHSDGGADPSFRIYPDTNSAWCFSESEYFSPVKLYAQYTGQSLPAAAEALLALVRHAPTDPAQRWEAALAGPESTLSLDALAAALQTYCARVSPSWTTQQFEEPYAEWLSKCLSLLGKVRTPSEAASWLVTTKLVMERELRRHNEAD